jgi:hypothetical protein
MLQEELPLVVEAVGAEGGDGVAVVRHVCGQLRAAERHPPHAGSHVGDAQHLEGARGDGVDVEGTDAVSHRVLLFGRRAGEA